MRFRLFVEPLGKAREEVLLESCIPFEMQQIRQWRESWISQNDYKNWSKESKSSELLGEIRQGKIVDAKLRDAGSEAPFKGELLACRSYVTEVTGSKKRLPMVLFVKLKKTVDFEFFSKNMSLSPEQESELKDTLKEDVWAPISVWHPQPVDRKHLLEAADVLPYAIQYAKALFSLNPKSAGLSSFAETEILKG
ncbi:MAG: hypothetical protein C4K48_02675 [Candidatus Thorarchaeota archaeon]|nr:MAG: hypothetical protein C4K48_02675 [Candidatus Thorarchaeota archaeon]